MCFISDGDPQDLVNKMVDHLELISDHSYHLLREEFADVYDQLDQREVEEAKCESTKTGLTAKQLRHKLDAYLHELPVVVFNSFQRVTNLAQQTDQQASHDTTDSREENEEEEGKGEEKEEDDEVEKDDRSKLKFLVKNMNQYKCVSTEKLKFLDIMSFIAPGFSYAKYLAAFEVEEQKEFFPMNM